MSTSIVTITSSVVREAETAVYIDGKAEAQAAYDRKAAGKVMKKSRKPRLEAYEGRCGRQAQRTRIAWWENEDEDDDLAPFWEK